MLGARSDILLVFIFSWSTNMQVSLATLIGFSERLVRFYWNGRPAVADANPPADEDVARPTAN